MREDQAHAIANHLVHVCCGKPRVLLGKLRCPGGVRGRQRVCHHLLPGRSSNKQLLHTPKFSHQARRQDGKPHDLDEADILALDVVPLLVRVEDAQRVLGTCDVAPKGKIGLVRGASHVALGINAANNGCHRVVRSTVRVVRNHSHRLVAPGAPRRNHVVAGVKQLFPAFGGEAQD